MAKFIKFEIDPDSEVKGSGAGYIVVTTTPDYPVSQGGTSMKDHKKNYVYKHKVIIENSIGRFTRKNEVIDHLDEDKSNNALSNLKLTDKRTHPGKHMKKNKVYKHSPMTKPGRKACVRVISNYLGQLLDNQ